MMKSNVRCLRNSALEWSRLLAAAFGALIVATTAAAAQQSSDARHHGATPSPTETIKGGAIQVSPHLRSTPPRKASAADSARATAIVDSLRRSITRYKNVQAAVADGYERFTPERRQRVVHFTNRTNASKNNSSLDPGRPTSLLYSRGPNRSLVLTGAMFTAPKDATMEELDARVPLGIAQWHLHTNVCVPRRGDNKRWSEMRDGKPLFGPEGGISTKEACDKVGGQFRETEFNWMVHVDFTNDGEATWGH